MECNWAAKCRGPETGHQPTNATARKARDAFEGKGPPRRPQKRLDRRLEECAKSVGGSYCRLKMPLKLAIAVKEAGRRLGALEAGGGGTSPHSNESLGKAPYLPNWFRACTLHGSV